MPIWNRNAPNHSAVLPDFSANQPIFLTPDEQKRTCLRTVRVSEGAATIGSAVGWVEHQRNPTSLRNVARVLQQLRYGSHRQTGEIGYLIICMCINI